ncbi:hypothetical protein [Sphingomonas sp.]|uniref:hypothetical protein n=1 Tax=Sphingomonas sp. TaxID=28214 RepID=UPI00257BD82B|nr:hypothetical protein [Sphingomonas sp.]
MVPRVDDVGETRSGTNSVASLVDSAFALLEVSPRTNAQGLNEAYDQLSFEQGQNPHLLDAARARLLNPRDRLGEELRWLPEMNPASAREAASAVRSRSLVDLRRSRDGASGLARINLGLALIELLMEPGREPGRVLGDALSWQSDTTRKAVEEARAVAGSKPVAPDAWEQALAERRSAIAGALGSAFASSPQATADLSERARADSLTREASLLLDGVVAAYGERVGPELSRLRDEIAKAEQTLRARPHSPGAVEVITTALARWAPLSRPVQRREAARGLDDAQGEALFWLVRGLAVDLANDHGRFQDAQVLSKALANAFSDTPSLAQKTSDDLTQLVDLVARQRDEDALAPLQTARDEALHRSRQFSDGVLAGGLDREHGPAGAFARAFRKTLTAQLSDGDLPWRIARSAAIELHNKHDLSDAAARLIDWLLAQGPSVSIASTLGNDLRTVKGVIATRDLTQAMKTGRLDQAAALLDSVPIDAVGGADQHAALKRKVHEKLASRRAGKFLLAGIAAVTLFAVVAGSVKEGSSPPYETGNDAVTDLDTTDQMASMTDQTTADGSSEAATEAIATDDTGLEEPPPPNAYALLTRPQVRWCAFESARLDAVNGQVPDAAVPAFNEAVRDYNARCYMARHNMDDKAAVDAEVAAAGAAIRRSGLARLQDWAPAYAPRLPTFGEVLGESQSSEPLPTSQPSVSEDNNDAEDPFNNGM